MVMTSNPAFRNMVPTRRRGRLGRRGRADSYRMPFYRESPSETGRPVTVGDVVSRSALTLSVLTAAAVLTGLLGWEILALPGVVAGLAIGVYLGRRPRASSALTLSYAVAEGVVVGAATLQFHYYVAQALVGTGGVFFGMLVAYRTRKIRISTQLTRWIVGSASGLAILTLVNLVAGAALGINLRLAGGGTVALAFSVVCVCVAAFTFLLNFDAADQMIRYGADSKWAWYVAFGLAVAIVWLYLEMLRLPFFRLAFWA
jgi:uncharacterized YccA/Bax inhibitor family protein